MPDGSQSRQLHLVQGYGTTPLSAASNSPRPRFELPVGGLALEVPIEGQSFGLRHLVVDSSQPVAQRVAQP